MLYLNDACYQLFVFIKLGKCVISKLTYACGVYINLPCVKLTAHMMAINNPAYNVIELNRDDPECIVLLLLIDYLICIFD